MARDPAFGTTSDPVVWHHPNGTVTVQYQDDNGRYWIEEYWADGHFILRTTDSGDPNDLTEWRHAEPHEYAAQGHIGRSYSALQGSPPLEESTPLFGPQEPPAPEPDYGPGDQPREGHWDPAKLQWVYDEPTMKSAEILDDDHTHTLGERRLAADQESSAADQQGDLDDLAGPLKRTIHDVVGGQVKPTTAEGTAGGHKADLGDELAGPLRSGHWDPAALRWVDEPTSSDVGTAGGRLGRILDDGTLEAPPEQSGEGGSEPGEGDMPPGEVLGPDPNAPPDPNARYGEPGDLGPELTQPVPWVDSWDQPREGYWDPAALRFVYDEPGTMRSAGILGDNSENTIEQEAEPTPTDPWDQPREGQSTTMDSAGILGHGHTGTRGESRPAPDEESSAADLKADTTDPNTVNPPHLDTAGGPPGGWEPGDLLRSGGDPRVPFDPDTTPTSVEGTAAAPPILETPPEQGGEGAGEPTEPPVSEPTATEPPVSEPPGPPDPWDQPREGQPTTMDSAGILDDDSTSFEGSTTARGVDPSVPLDQANPNLQSGIPDLSGQAALGDYYSGPTLNPNLLDPTAPGASLDHGLVERIEQHPQLVNALNENEELANALEQDPTRIYQIEQELGLAAEDQRPMEPGGGATGLDSFREPSPTEEPGTTAGKDAHDQDFESI